MIGRVLLAAVLAGWLADRLARPDRDVEAGVEAYEAGELDAALERFDAAIERHGDQPELSYDRGLVLLAKGELDAARRAFEHASEAEDLEVRASAFYERGNVAFDVEDWDAAIEAYIECLKARPDHTNAKWNLELARLRKQQEEKEDEEDENEDENEEDDGGTGGEDSGGSEDSTGGSDDGGSTGGSDDGGSTGGGEDSGGETGQPPDDGGTSGGQPEPPDDGQETGEPPPDEGGTGEPPPTQPQPLDQLDLQKALDELDEQDHFPLDRPMGGVRPPTEDW